MGIFNWVGKRLRQPDARGAAVLGRSMRKFGGWPRSGWNVGQGRFESNLSSYPIFETRAPLEEWLKYPVKPLSLRAISGFLSRTEVSKLRFPPDFINTLKRYKLAIEKGKLNV